MFLQEQLEILSFLLSCDGKYGSITSIFEKSRCLSNRAYIYKKVSLSRLTNSVLTESSLHKLICYTEYVS